MRSEHKTMQILTKLGKKQCIYCKRLFSPKSPIQYVCGDYSCVKKRVQEAKARLKLVGDG